MDVGLTVGDSLERLADTVSGFDFVELSIGEGTATSEAPRASSVENGETAGNEGPPAGESGGGGADPNETPGAAVQIDEDRLDRLLTEAGADLCVHLPFEQEVATPVPEINDAIVAYQERLLDWAGSVGAEKAVLHGTVRNPHDVDLRPTFAAQLERIATAGADAGVEIVVENVGHQRRGLPHTVLGDIADETGTSVCFDVGHAYMEGGDDCVERFAKRYGDLVTHLHVHDARSRGDTHLPIGAGEIDYGIVAERFAGFGGTVAVEVFTDDHPLLRDTAERIAAHLGDGRAGTGESDG